MKQVYRILQSTKTFLMLVPRWFSYLHLGGFKALNIPNMYSKKIMPKA